jgi:hypothetical protein
MIINLHLLYEPKYDSTFPLIALSLIKNKIATTLNIMPITI